MKKGWETTKLGELCDILDSQRLPITKRDRTAGEYPYYGATGIVDYVKGFIFDEPLILVGEDGAKWESGENTAFKIEGKCWVNNHAHVLRPHRERLADSWLVHYLNHSDLTDFVSGLTVPKLNQGSLREIPIPLPPLSEQQRIVGILDEAFGGLATAQAHAAQNLQNARDLFESCSQVEVGKNVALGEIVDIKTGKLDANAAEEDGKFPFFTCSRETYAINDYAFDCEAVLLAGNNAIGDFNVKHYAGKFNAYQRTYVITINSNKAAISRYIYYQLQRNLAKFKSQSVGTGTKFLKLGMIKDMMIPLPTIPEQSRIVTQLDALSSETQRLARIYEQKLAALAELKKSLLHQAFSGDL